MLLNTRLCMYSSSGLGRVNQFQPGDDKFCLSYNTINWNYKEIARDTGYTCNTITVNQITNIKSNRFQNSHLENHYFYKRSQNLQTTRNFASRSLRGRTKPWSIKSTVNFNKKKLKTLLFLSKKARIQGMSVSSICPFLSTSRWWKRITASSDDPRWRSIQSNRNSSLVTDLSSAMDTKKDW